MKKMRKEDFERRTKMRDHVVLAEEHLLVPSEPSRRQIRWYVHKITNNLQQFILTTLSDIFENFGRRTDEIESYDNEKQVWRRSDGHDSLSCMESRLLKPSERRTRKPTCNSDRARQNVCLDGSYWRLQKEESLGP
jgi:hypothetical protein